MNDDVVRVELTDSARTARAQRAELVLPRLIVDAGPVAVARFLEFFAARIANRRTRAAYGRAVGQFLAWCAARGLGLTAVAPLHVAAYIRTHPGSAPTVKQHLAALRMLGDWLVVSQVLPVNPAAAVRGPKHVVTTGATPVLSPAEARRLLAAIDPGTLAGLRDRALEPYRVSRRPHCLGGWGLWDVQVGFLRRCVSAWFGWSRSIAPPTRRSGACCSRWRRSLAARPRRYGSGYARHSVTPAIAQG